MQADIKAFLAHLSAPVIFASQSRRRLKPGTVQQYYHGIRMLISALVGAGEDVASMTRLGDVVTAAKVEGGRAVSKPLCMKVADWPRIDCELWIAACQPVRFLEQARPASKWSPARRRIAEQGYGQWLAWLDRENLLDPDGTPWQRVTPERLDAFIAELQDRVSPWSVAMMIGALKRVLDVVAPEADWSPLGSICTDLKQIARPSRDRFSHMVTPRELFELGMSMMDVAAQDHGGHPMRVAVGARDGLMIAMLICCPVRIANLLQIEIGMHLLRDGDRYRLHFDKAETKTGKEFDGDLPSSLTPYIDCYLRHYRLALLMLGAGEKTDRLWIDRWGKPMAEAAIRAQIEFNTCNAFGRHVWPHLFRAIAVTGVVDEAPEQIGITPDLLGHASIQTTSRHYLLANATRAHQRVQASFLDGRAEALRRLRNQAAGSEKDGAPDRDSRIKIRRRSGHRG
jgi:integrase